MKTLLLSFFLSASFLSSAQVQWGTALRYVFEGEGYLDPPDRYTALGSSIMFSGEAAFPWGDWLVGGGYVNFSSGVEIYYLDYSPSVLELGFFLGPQFDVGSDHQARAVAQIGYRGWLGGGNAMEGLGTNLNMNFIFNKSSSISPKIDLGFVAQPVGGNDIYFFSHSPTWYIGGGAIFR